ncbi:MAG: hypothetical protein IPG04_24270 [Polyangiaceae bacterium]|nr:hypothetical protein [Polyangiaceae bacterium]
MATKKKKKAGPTFVANKNLAVCTDGKPVREWEKEGAKKAGLSVADWRKKVAETLKAADKKSVAEAFATGEGKSWADEAGTMADRFNAVANGMEEMQWDSPDKLQNMLEGGHPGLEAMGVDIKGYTQYKRPMWTYLKKKGLVEDRNWQHTSAVSWVDKKTKKRYYAENTIPYVIRRSGTAYDFPKGAILKLVDGKDPTNFAYAQVLGVGPSGDPKLELSQGAWGYLGYAADGKSVPAGSGSLGYQQVVPGGISSSTSTMLSGDQIQLAGALGEAGLLGREGKATSIGDIDKAVDGLDEAKLKKLDPYLNEGAKRALEERKKRKKETADASQSGSGPKLIKGFETVFAGPEGRKVGYADAKCIHQAGGHVSEGSDCVYVGKWPLARIGDGTSDDKEVKTGNETIFVGGNPTSATLVA